MCVQFMFVFACACLGVLWTLDWMSICVSQSVLVSAGCILSVHIPLLHLYGFYVTQLSILTGRYYYLRPG